MLRISFVLNFLLIFLRLSSQAANLSFGQITTGAISSPAQSNSYPFAGVAKDVISIDMVTTTGSLIPRIRIYNPDGSLLDNTYSGYPFSCSGSTVETGAVTLPVSGNYNILI